ncbi:DNA polymerase III subunit beta [bacterium]|nr:DNA polymerase III subunit beta [bacterium]
MAKLRREELADVLSHVVRLTASQRTLPILSNVYVFSSEGRMHLMASNYEMWIEEAIPVDEELGEFLIKGKTFQEVVSSLEGEEVEIVLGEEKVTIVCNQTKYELEIWKEEFPTPPAEKFEQEFTFSGERLKEGYAKVSFAVAKEDIRPEFTGILLDARDGYLNFVASDASRLALQRFPYEGEDFQFLIPEKAFSELVRIIEEEDEVIIGHNDLIAITGMREGFPRFRLISRAITRRFPSYDKVIPAQGKVQLMTERDKFMRALQRARIVARENMERVKLEVERERIIVSAEAPALGRFQEDVPAMVEGESESYVFNVQFLLEGLRVIDEDNVRFTLGEPTQAAKMEKAEGDDWVYVVMPMHPS